ncbi:MAG TPA: hypothetical protein VFU19_15325 [Iamia sp.]|nr:hypothetical protein [Iamia sp.]
MPADLPPSVVAAIEASVAAIAGEPVAEDDPSAHRAAVVIRAIQAHRPPAAEG